MFILGSGSWAEWISVMTKGLYLSARGGIGLYRCSPGFLVADTIRRSSYTTSWLGASRELDEADARSDRFGVAFERQPHAG